MADPGYRYVFNSKSISWERVCYSRVCINRIGFGPCFMRAVVFALFLISLRAQAGRWFKPKMNGHGMGSHYAGQTSNDALDSSF